MVDSFYHVDLEEEVETLKTNITLHRQIVDLIDKAGPEGATLNVRKVYLLDCSLVIDVGRLATFEIPRYFRQTDC